MDGHTSSDLHWIPGHATQATTGLSGTWAEVHKPKPMCTWKIQPRHGLHGPVFYIDVNLFDSIHFPIFCGLGLGILCFRTACENSALCPLWLTGGTANDQNYVAGFENCVLEYQIHISYHVSTDSTTVLYFRNMYGKPDISSLEIMPKSCCCFFNWYLPWQNIPHEIKIDNHF